MKARLTENGILTLYNPSLHTPVKVQVLYLCHLNMLSFLRVTDSKNLSPLMIIMQMNEKFIVGDIILIKKVQIQPTSVFKEEEISYFIDSDLTVLVIFDYQIVEKKAKLFPLFQFQDSSNSENAYWNSLSVIRNSLFKGDNIAEAVFRESEDRLQLLRPDCNLLRERGNELFKKQNYAEAILHYESAKQKNHFDARVWNNSSQAYFSNNEYHKAKLDALVALKLDPFNKKAYFRAGRAMERAGDLNGALEIIEAGLYVCGPFEDLEKLLRQIKGKTEDSQNSNSHSSKKKIPNGESINGGDNSFVNGQGKKNLKSKESSLKKNKETEPVKQDKDEIKIDLPNDMIKPNKKRVLSFLEGAKVLYENGKFKNALELYEYANASWGNSKGKDIEIIRFMINICKIKLKVENVNEIKNNLASLLSQGTFPYIPALHYWLAVIYESLEDQAKVNHHANACLQSVENSNQSYNLFWPGTKEAIFETSPEQLKNWFTAGTWRSAPLAKCRHSDCLIIQNHKLAKTEIYASDIDFRGYVEVECEELCSICYHPCCWKAIKEHSENNQPGKKMDKEYLGNQCFTPDCSGKISSIRIYDETSRLKIEIVKDRKDKKNNASSTKSKKKKEKKKPVNQSNKSDDKKKLKSTNETEELIIQGGDAVVKEESSLCKTNIAEKNLGSDVNLEHFNLEGDNFRILKPNNESEEFLQPSSKKNKKNKKKKSKQLPQINLVEDIEDRIVNNEYLTRLKLLKVQREAMESDGSQFPSNVRGLRYIPQCILDPDKPFYLPEHLQENPAQLESILRAKMAAFSSSDIDKESITTLLEFMYDWLKAQSPMSINDSRIKEYISENFPPKALAYVNKCGGIRNFLLQSFRFALIDEVICVNEQVVSAQEMAINLVLEKFKSPKFLISDGHKAVKLSHLLDDTKSICSSTSSLSTTLTTAVTQGAPVESTLGTKPNYSTSATPYKNAALAKKDNGSQKINPSPVIKVKSTPQTTPITKKIEKDKSEKKTRLKTMDMDKFEIDEPYSFRQLFKQDLANSNDRTTKNNSNLDKGELYFQSDEELDNEVAALNSSSKLKHSTGTELKEKVAYLEAELKQKNIQINKITEEKEMLSSQNQILNDRFSQIKTKSSVEIAALKKSNEDAIEQTKMAERNFETYKNKKEGELRKLLMEKSRFQEEMKTYSLKIDSLQLTIDQLNSSKVQFEEEVNQKSIQLISFQDSAKSLDDRARDAESKYLTIKRDLIKINLEKTKKRLTAEMNKMCELLLDATEKTQPSKAVLERSIAEWEETIAKLQSTLHTVNEDCQKLLNSIQLGRSLSFLPPGDLQIPSVPDLTVAHLLFVGKPVLDSSSKGPEKISSNSNSFSLLANPFDVSSSSYNNFGRPFMLGQLGVTPTGTSQAQTNDSIMGNGLSRVGHSSNRLINDRPLGLGIAHMVDGNSGFTNLIGEDLRKGRSSDSSPITTPLTAMSSFTGTNDFSSSPFFVGNKPTDSESNALLAGPLQWGFNAEDHLKLGYGNPLNSQTKEIKRPSKVIRNSQSRSPSLEPVPDLPLLPPPSTMPSLSHPTCQSSSCSSSAAAVAASSKQVGGVSAFGLHSLLEGRDGVTPPATPSATKPKFQNLRSTNSIGAIGTLPPKVVRPTPRPGTSPAVSVQSGLQSVAKDDSMATSGAYKRLIEGCKRKFGNEYPVQFIQKAIREVREQNKNSLSGLPFETILDQVEVQLRVHKRMPTKPSVAPWAQLTQSEGGMEPPWQATVLGSLETSVIGGKAASIAAGGHNISEDHCAICLEMLQTSPTMGLPCQHVFHIKCIKNWLDLKSDCPICRKFALNSDEYPSLSHG